MKRLEVYIHPWTNLISKFDSFHDSMIKLVKENQYALKMEIEKNNSGDAEQFGC